jgi:hypothetical protein
MPWITVLGNPLPEEIPIVMIKGSVPNFITGRSTIADLQSQENDRAEADGDTPRKILFCMFCGRSQKSMQSLRAHLRYCRGKRAYQQAVNDGITFTVGGRSFTVAARSIKLYAGLEKYEQLINEKIRDGSWDPREAAGRFYALIHGASLVAPEGWVRLVSKEALNGD